jgi:Zn-dependent alcohol dehydrogenase
MPKKLSYAAASGLSDNIADGYRTVAPHLKIWPKAPALVVGGLAQRVGLYAVQSAISCGSEKVVYVDNDKHRLAVAKSLGAETMMLTTDEMAVLEKFPEEEFLVTVDAACTLAGVNFAMNLTLSCGFCTSVSGGFSENSITFEADTAVVINADMRNFPSHSLRYLSPTACGSMSWSIKTSELFHVHMNQAAGMFTFISHRWGLGSMDTSRFMPKRFRWWATGDAPNSSAAAMRSMVHRIAAAPSVG